MHGDFAPWNIKVHPGSGEWQVFDWERGDLAGVPGWDWLHFEIQTAILVRGEAPERIAVRLHSLFVSPEFHDYAERAGIAGIERAIAVAYLLHVIIVHPQTEGLAKLEALLHLLAAS